MLSIAGLSLAGYLTYLHVRLHYDPTYVSVCAFGARVNCETVAASSYSVALGLPVSVWGSIGYLVLAWLALSHLSRRRGGEGNGFLALYGIALAVTSIALAWVSSFVIGAVCLLCTATYAVNLLVAAIAVARTRRRGGLVACIAGDVRSLLAAPAPAARTAAALLLATVLIHVLVPRYWELASWRQGAFGDTGVTDEGYPWIGASEPELTIHEYLDYECPHCKLAHRKLRRIVSQRRDEIRLVRHDYARMACKPNSAEKRRASCAMARAAFCALDRGMFWEWNDAVLAHPRPLTGDERKTYITEMARKIGLDPDRLDRCMFSEKTVERAHAVYLDARAHKITETPGYMVDGQRLTWAELQDLVDQRL
jgi:uncharacterized membrane protein